jgi:broad specificity phosphatase PhoE
LREVRFDTAHSSDLRRCLETAGIIASAGARPVEAKGALRICAHEELREIDAGLWEGLTFEEARERYPREWAERERDLVGYRFPGGESFRGLRGRVLPVFARIAKGGGKNVLVVTHRGPMRVILCESLGLPLERVFSLAVDYGSVEILKGPRIPV